MKHTVLKTAAEVALIRSAAAYRQVKAAAKAAAWASRLDVDAYSCTREGDTWIATGPAGQVFEFTKTDSDDVLVMSHSGGIYLITVIDDQFVCDCKSAQKVGRCKHLVGWDAVRETHRQEREAAKAALRIEAREMQDDDDPTPAPSGAGLPALIEVVEAVADALESVDSGTCVFVLAQQLREALERFHNCDTPAALPLAA